MCDNFDEFSIIAKIVSKHTIKAGLLLYWATNEFKEGSIFLNIIL